MIKRTYHQLLLLGAVLACVITSAIFGRTKLPHTRTLKMERTPALASSEPKPSSDAANPDGRWEAANRSNEGEWRFELFTPPPMSWDASGHAFKLARPPATNLADGSVSPPRVFETGSEDQDQILPRLRLLGYVQRNPGEIAGVLQNIQTGEVRVTRSGSPVDDWQVRIERIELEAARIASGTANLQPPRARAFIRDDVLGCTYPLSTDEEPAPSLNLVRRADLVAGKDFSRDG